jgi:nucleoid DNA-binding protein
VQSHIASYLFQLNSISLPGLGSFSVSESPATTDFVNRQIKAPGLSVVFDGTATEDAASDFFRYVSQKEGISGQQVAENYKHWCDGVLQQVQQGGQVVLSGIGTWHWQNGALVFVQEQLPGAFFPSVQAERVVHPEVEHSMLVGDKETTNVEMTDYFATDTVKKDRWWLWALLLALLGTGTILFGILQHRSGVFGTGNNCTTEPIIANTLYRVIQ